VAQNQSIILFKFSLTWQDIEVHDIISGADDNIFPMKSY